MRKLNSKKLSFLKYPLEIIRLKKNGDHVLLFPLCILVCEGEIL